MTAVRDRRALVTGAGHGLGRALAGRLARAGAEVVVTDRDPARVEAVVGELTAVGLSYSLSGMFPSASSTLLSAPESFAWERSVSRVAG